MDSPAGVILTSNKTAIGPVINQFGVVSRSEYDIDSLHAAEPIGDCGTGAVMFQGEVGRTHIVNTHDATIDMAAATGRGNARQIASDRTVKPLEGATAQSQVVSCGRDIGGVAGKSNRSTT